MLNTSSPMQLEDFLPKYTLHIQHTAACDGWIWVRMRDVLDVPDESSPGRPLVLISGAEWGPTLLHTLVTQGFRARAPSRCAAAAPTKTGRIVLDLLLDEYLLDVSHLTGFSYDKIPYIFMRTCCCIRLNVLTFPIYEATGWKKKKGAGKTSLFTILPYFREMDLCAVVFENIANINSNTKLCHFPPV